MSPNNLIGGDYRSRLDDQKSEYLPNDQKSDCTPDDPKFQYSDTIFNSEIHDKNDPDLWMAQVLEAHASAALGDAQGSSFTETSALPEASG